MYISIYIETLARMSLFSLFAATLISRFTASVAPKIVLLFGVLEQLFYIMSNLTINDVIV
jgi:hypothetical protein